MWSGRYLEPRPGRALEWGFGIPCSWGREPSVDFEKMTWYILHYIELPSALWIGCKGSRMVQGDQSRTGREWISLMMSFLGTQSKGMVLLNMGLGSRVVLLFFGADFKLFLSKKSVLLLLTNLFWCPDHVSESMLLATQISSLLTRITTLADGTTLCKFTDKETEAGGRGYWGSCQWSLMGKGQSSGFASRAYSRAQTWQQSQQGQHWATHHTELQGHSHSLVA